KTFHLFIFGNLNGTLNQIIGQPKANIPPASVIKTEITFLAKKKEARAKTNSRIQNICEERKRNCQNVSIEVSKNQHSYIICPQGQIIQEILESAVSFVISPPEMHPDTITVKGEQAKLGPSLILVYSKHISVKIEHIHVPSWLHKCINGER
ncbi:vigilin, partial [Nephila pilipes]